MTEKKENALSRFFRETKGELLRVSWPTREEALNLTWIVLVVLVVMAIFLGLIDFVGAALVDLSLGV